MVITIINIFFMALLDFVALGVPHGGINRFFTRSSLLIGG